MQGFYGRIWYGVQGAKGTAATSFAPIGIIGRANRRIPAGLEKLFGVGSWNAMELSEGMTLGEVGISIAALEDPHFCQYARRSDVTGELTWLTIKMGYVKGAEVYTSVIQDCKMDSLGLRLEAGGRISVDLSLIGGKVTNTAADPGDMSNLDARAYRSFEAVWDEVLDLRAFSLDVRNNISPIPVIAGSGTTRDPDRIWDYLDEGRNDVGGSLTYRAGDVTRDLQDCLLTGADHDLVFTSCGDISPAQSMTISLTGLKLESEDFQLQADADVLFECPYLATDWEITG